MKYLILGVLFLCFVACSSNTREEMPEELLLYGNQIMYFYEDPTVERLKLAIKYRGPAIRLMFEKCDASAYKHAITADSVFFSLVNEKYKYGITPETYIDEVPWSSDILLKHPVKYGGDLDLYWVAFFATGDFMWVDLVISNIAKEDKGISGPARWSCRANYRQHRKIKEYLDGKPELKAIVFEDKVPG